MNAVKALGQQDDENYIYFDKDGNVQARVELTVKWESAPSTKVLVTCNSK